MNILVTGASRGIGRVIALELKQLGNVYGSARDEKALKSLELAGYCLCDLACEADLEKLGCFIADKNIDVLINNAGEYIYSPVEKTELEGLNHIMAVNIKAPIYLAGCAVPYMKKK